MTDLTKLFGTYGATTDRDQILIRMLHELGLIASSTGGAGTIETDNEPMIDIDFIKVGGEAVDTVAYTPTYTAEDASLFAFDKDNGGVLVNQANLALGEDEVLAHVGATDLNTGSTDTVIDTALTTTPISIKASAGNLYGWNIINPNQVAVYVKFYDVAAGNVVLGTTVPVKTLMIPAAGFFHQSPITREEVFATAISFVATANLIYTDITPPGFALHAEVKFK